ncbi:D-fructose 1,6-bisphosphatase [Metallosphaera tengchongensis]|uniref:D-fructose 1,6-bisphosphatase n=1 Tax=Metallosphaera tengchongensis TaxID=1532350 RepID=A0A6N0NZN2_9CREN|nr:inositol monophosphatase family protein [Metallosphaera tengchongensis]QKR00530.1 D-fructose 1,6-bisphosphatase [Metallosphaera tengchongensis]
MREEIEKVTREAAAYLNELNGKEGLDKVLKVKENDTTKVIDKMAEDFILDRINNLGYSMSFVTEEGGFIGKEGTEYVAVIDPLDGSTNYLNGITWASVSIAIYTRAGRPVAGSVGEIFSNRVYSYDERNAYVNGVKFSPTFPPKQRIVLAYFEKGKLEKVIPVLTKIKGGYKSRNLGSASLDVLLVCTGRAYLFIDVRNKLRNVDVASSLNFCERVNVNPVQLEGGKVDINLKEVSVIKSLLVTSDPSLSQQILSEWKALSS